jgi:ABC-type transport system involved in multi-copper enzyme maturation permease subunit
MTTTNANSGRPRPSWFTRFWAVVRYEMLWNIRKKKFIGIIIISFAFATLGLVLPVVLSSTPIEANPDYVIGVSMSSFAFFLFALATAMNSISSEFESGTIVPLLTKPVSRTMVFLGKLFAAFIIIMVAYTILYVFTLVGGILIYGPQNSLHLVPLALFGDVISTFIWVALILAMGALSRNTMIAALVGLGVFLALLIALPIVSVFAGPSPALNYIPGSGAGSGGNAMLNLGIDSKSIGTGTDNIGVNLINWILYPSANVSFTKIDLTTIQVGQSTEPAQTLVYTEPISVVALRSLGVAFVYIFVFLFIAWCALKRAQILE